MAREHPEIPVMLVSAYDHEAFSEERRPASLVGFLKRPVDVRDLGVMLETTLAERRAWTRRRRLQAGFRPG